MSKVQAKQICLNGNNRYYLTGDVDSIKHDVDNSGFKYLRISVDGIPSCHWVGDMDNVETLKTLISGGKQSIKMIIDKPVINQKVLIFPDHKISSDMSKTIVGSISAVSTDNNLVIECTIKTENQLYPSAIGIISYGKWIAIILDNDNRISGYGSLSFVS